MINKELDSILKELLAGPRPSQPIVPIIFNGKPVAELDEKEKGEFILSLQPASTQATLRRDPKEDTLYRPIYTHTHYHNNIVAALYANQEGTRNCQCNSKESTLTKEKRMRAIKAFEKSNDD